LDKKGTVLLLEKVLEMMRVETAGGGMIPL
jgi:hypothetical protein